jgi:hypothetical protein
VVLRGKGAALNRDLKPSNVLELLAQLRRDLDCAALYAESIAAARSALGDARKKLAQLEAYVRARSEEA